MRVLQLSWEFPPHSVGGLGRHVAELAPTLGAVGDQITVITPQLRGGACDEALAPNVQVHRVDAPLMDSYDFPAFVAQTNIELERAALALLDAHHRPDLIHTHDWLTAAAAIALKHHWRVPLIATVHATERGRGRGHLLGRSAEIINDLEWRLTYEAWRVIVCSQFMAGQIADYFSTPGDKIDVVPNGVRIRPSPFATPAACWAFRRRFLAEDEALIFYVGRVVYEKGLQVLLAAWPTIAAGAAARLVIAGTGEYLEPLKQQAAGLGLAGQVIFTGFLSDDDRDRLYHAADVTVFPSLYEPFGIVALEASAARCPVVVAATGGLAEVVAPDITGVVVPPGDPAALAAGVLACLTHPEQAHARAATALAMVQARFTWEHVAAETRLIYRRVLGEWQTSPWGKEITAR